MGRDKFTFSSMPPFCAQVQSPLFVYGDIHGNFKDLLNYSRHFWPLSPFINLSKYLFLGDYVDRGKYGIECIVFLLCFKILAPNNFFLVRGNHEIRCVQESFTFLQECRQRLSVEMWQMFNEVFDRMPLVARIDGRLYSAHGGLPTSVNTLDQLTSIPCPLAHPEQQSPEAWQIL